MSFGAGASPSASSQASSESGDITVGGVSAPVINLGQPGQVSPLVYGGVAVAVVFAIIIFFATRKT